MGLRKKSTKNMGFAAEIWVCAVDFAREWSRMGESFESGIAGIFGLFPYFNHPAVRQSNRKSALS